MDELPVELFTWGAAALIVILYLVIDGMAW